MNENLIYVIAILVILVLVLIGLAILRGDWFKIRFIRSIGESFAEDDKNKLIASIVIDVIGLFTYAFLGVLEVTDIFWAFISRELMIGMYGKTRLSNFNFLEEILPFTDFIPTATIGYFLSKKEKKE